MQVRATRVGFYGSRRRYPGEVFEYDPKLMKKDKNGKVILPSWTEPADQPAKVARKEEAQESAPTDKDKQVI